MIENKSTVIDTCAKTSGNASYPVILLSLHVFAFPLYSCTVCKRSWLLLFYYNFIRSLVWKLCISSESSSFDVFFSLID